MRYSYRKIGILLRVNIVAVTEYSKSFSESDQSACQETSGVASDFNHPSEDYVNYISTDLSAKMISTQNYGQNSARQSRRFRSWT